MLAIIAIAHIKKLINHYIYYIFIITQKMSKSFNKGLRKADVIEYGYESRPVFKQVVHHKWSAKIVEKKHRKLSLNRERTSKYYGDPDLSLITVPHLFLAFWPPTFDDLIKCQSSMPPIFEGCLKDEFLWWLKKL
jgi:hypothetical protein